ncbi:MAG TPA: hypothetical protein VLF19_09425 [Methylomirabilota bacterium]|nr:hypothetical protein [Methylomirabilota bacterium]
MKLPRLTLIVAVYVALDVSNPLMPGALTFGVEDSVEARQADRFRGHDDAASPALTPAVEGLAPVEPSVTASRLVVVTGLRFRRLHAARSDPSQRAPAPSPEDH